MCDDAIASTAGALTCEGRHLVEQIAEQLGAVIIMI
jgi:hypothetical protein